MADEMDKLNMNELDSLSLDETRALYDKWKDRLDERDPRLAVIRGHIDRHKEAEKERQRDGQGR